jgi:hypothetical protein
MEDTVTNVRFGIVLGITLFLSSIGCIMPCGGGYSTTEYVDNVVCSGVITAPAALSLVTGLPAMCTGGPSACMATSACLTNPGACNATCTQIDVPGLIFRTGMQLVFNLSDVQHSQAVTLPNPKVMLDARLFNSSSGLNGIVLALTGGTFSVALANDRLKSTFSLALTAPGGDEITITDATYALTEHLETVCHAN